MFGTLESPTGLWIAFGGVAAALPSKANAYRAYRRRIVVAPRVKGITEALTALLEKALAEAGCPGIKFVGQVCVDVYCGHRAGRWDSHNSPKFVGDWLQKLGIIGDDSNAEILPYKKSDYLDDKDLLATTEIIIQPRTRALTAITKAHIEERKKISTGLELIG